jgi:hypothetical protein
MLSLKGPTTSLDVRHGVSHPLENPEVPINLVRLIFEKKSGAIAGRAQSWPGPFAP